MLVVSTVNAFLLVVAPAQRTLPIFSDGWLINHKDKANLVLAHPASAPAQPMYVATTRVRLI